MQSFYGFVRNIAAFETYPVGTEDSDFTIGDGGGEGHHVLRDHAIAADEGVTADAAELVDSAESTDGCPIVNLDMAGERDCVGEDGIATDQAIMRDMDIGHEPVAVTDAGKRSTAFGAAVDGDEFADGIAIAHAGLRGLAFIFLVLGGDAHGGERIEEIVRADDGRAINVIVRHQAGAGTDFDIGTDDAVGANLGGGMNAGRGTDQLCWSLRSSLHMTSASATRTPLTVARPDIFATVPFFLRTLSSMRS